jgi:uncharacterized protein YceK
MTHLHKIIPVSVFFFVFLVLSGCSSHSSLAEPKTLHAEKLSLYCESNNIEGEEVEAARKSLTKAQSLLDNFSKYEAYMHADLAVIGFRTAIARAELAQTQKEEEDLAQKIAEDEKQIAAYREVLEQIKSRGQGGLK